MIFRHTPALMLLACSIGTAAHSQPTSLEYDVKAAFVLNFARYVEWPPAAVRSPFVICLYRDNPFGSRLDSIVAGERWNDLPVTTRVVDDLDDGRDCPMLYVPASTAAVFAAERSQLQRRPVLTIGEDGRFLERGGIIRLFVEQNHVRFAINQPAATAAGLQVSSRLLRLARPDPRKDDSP